MGSDFTLMRLTFILCDKGPEEGSDVCFLNMVLGVLVDILERYEDTLVRCIRAVTTAINSTVTNF